MDIRASEVILNKFVETLKDKKISIDKDSLENLAKKHDVNLKSNSNFTFSEKDNCYTISLPDLVVEYFNYYSSGIIQIRELGSLSMGENIIKNGQDYTEFYMATQNGLKFFETILENVYAGIVKSLQQQIKTERFDDVISRTENIKQQANDKEPIKSNSEVITSQVLIEVLQNMNVDPNNVCSNQIFSLLAKSTLADKSQQYRNGVLYFLEIFENSQKDMELRNKLQQYIKTGNSDLKMENINMDLNTIFN